MKTTKLFCMSFAPVPLYYITEAWTQMAVERKINKTGQSSRRHNAVGMRVLLSNDGMFSVHVVLVMKRFSCAPHRTTWRFKVRKSSTFFSVHFHVHFTPLEIVRGVLPHRMHFLWRLFLPLYRFIYLFALFIDTLHAHCVYRNAF